MYDMYRKKIGRRATKLMIKITFELGHPVDVRNVHGCVPSWQLACIQQSLGIAEGVRIILRDLRAFPIPICSSVLMVPPDANLLPFTYNHVYKRRALALWRSRGRRAAGPLNNLPLPRGSDGEGLDTNGFICFMEKIDGPYRS